MSIKTIADGVWPTMLTPFTQDGKIDYPNVERLVEWYIERGVAGIFAVCKSSEMFELEPSERIELAEFVNKRVNGRVGVVASGHCADDLDQQVEDIKKMAATGVSAVVLLPNRFAAADESDEVLLKNMKYVLEKAPSDITFGLYECPQPYKRTITPEIVSFCRSTGRFTFLKDTCCDAEKVIKKVEAGQNEFKVFNANCAQLLITLRGGASGFSGVMANFHPELYAWLCENYEKEPKKAEKAQNFLGIASCIEGHSYPTCAKVYLRDFFFPSMTSFCRGVPTSAMLPSMYTEVGQLRELYTDVLGALGISFPFKV